MGYALVAMCIGTIAYLGMLIFQSPQSRRDISAWGDLLFISAVVTAFLGIIMFWGIFDRLGKTTFVSLVDELFQRRPHSGLVNLKAFPGFMALPFTLLAGLHVSVLLFLNRASRGHDA